MVQVRILAAEQSDRPRTGWSEQEPGGEEILDDESAVVADGGHRAPLGAPPDPDPAPGLLLSDAVLAVALDGLAAVSGPELLTRARDLLTRTQRERPARQRAGVTAIDALLAEAGRRGDAVTTAALLRHAAGVRLVSHTPLAEADPLLDQLTAHTERHGMTVLLASAHALRARRAVLAGAEEAALTDAATALALLAGRDGGPFSEGEPTARRQLGEVLGELGLALVQLGAHELADEVLTRSEQHLHAAAGPLEQLVNGLNRLRLLLSWGLRLERAGHATQAVERFAVAARVGAAVEPLWRSAMVGPGTAHPPDQCAVLGASLALADPGPGHVPRLRRLARIANFSADRIVVGIALARCLESAGQVPAAMSQLGALRAGLLASPARAPMLELALSRELARLQDVLMPADQPVVGSGQAAIRDYAAALEAEMWSLRQARIAAMRSQAEHLRLAREHGAVAAQALTDPLTGLPNRRALDERLRTALAPSAPLPCSVALVDLDRFKNVNDRRSHAAGDDVLRAVAGALRSALRGDDTVARYGGDEFVVVLPGTPLPAARSALQRAALAVAGLPVSVGAGVTLSAGVVAVAEQDRPDGATSVLARADTAMYRAKRRGGNQVCGGPEDCADGGPEHGGDDG